MNVIFWTNSPFLGTGYGTQAKQISQVLKEMNHKMSFISNWGLTGTHLLWGDSIIYPDSHDPAIINAYIEHAKADVLISLWDIWAMPSTGFAVPWVAMFPVDGYPISDEVGDRIARADYPVVYSRFGQREVEKAGHECTYIPHMIDTDVFHPGDKREARAQMGLDPDVFLVSCVAANKGYPPRKAWPELLRAFAQFHLKHPNSILYLHTTQRPAGPGGIVGGGGIDFNPLIKEMNLPDNSVIAFPNQGSLAIGIAEEALAKIYRASDVLLLPSMGEGFCLPVVEAQACGCPVVTQACSAMTENTVNGVAVQAGQPFWVVNINCWWHMPDVARVTQALEDVYNWSDEQRVANSKLGIEFVQDNFSHAVVKEYWRKFMNRVENATYRSYR